MGWSADFFNRKPIADIIKKIIIESEGGVVVGVDAPWGAGKTSFIKLLEYELNDNTSFIYFDAFKSDHYHEPLIAIAGEIYSKAKKATVKQDSLNAFVDIVGKVAKISSTTGVKIILRALLNKALGSDGVADFHNLISAEEQDAIENNVGDDVSNEFTKRFSSPAKSEQPNILEQYQKEKNKIENIKIALFNLAQEIISIENNSSKNIVFVIDELDRCRPNFAVAVLEIIKHLFNASNVVFILAINREQLEASIKGEYGESFKAGQYLDKFIHVNFQLNSFSNEWDDSDLSIENYLLDLEEKLNIKLPQTIKDHLLIIIKSFNIPARTIQKIYVLMGIISTNNPKYLNSSISNLTTLFAAWSVFDKDKIKELLNFTSNSELPAKAQWLESACTSSLLDTENFITLRSYFCDHDPIGSIKFNESRDININDFSLSGYSYESAMIKKVCFLVNEINI